MYLIVKAINDLFKILMQHLNYLSYIQGLIYILRPLRRKYEYDDELLEKISYSNNLSNNTEKYIFNLDLINSYKFYEVNEYGVTEMNKLSTKHHLDNEILFGDVEALGAGFITSFSEILFGFSKKLKDFSVKDCSISFLIVVGTLAIQFSLDMTCQFLINYFLELNEYNAEYYLLLNFLNNNE
jgi:hypothetical protein